MFDLNFGKLALISDSDSHSLSARMYWLRRLYKELSGGWDVDVLMYGSRSPHASLNFCRPRYFPPAAALTLTGGARSPWQSSALEFPGEIGCATRLYRHCQEHPYDAYVFVGLGVPALSLLPETRKRNCVIPLFQPYVIDLIRRNAALHHALICCDYFLCHSRAEADAIAAVNPFSEARHVPPLYPQEVVNSLKEIPFGSVLVLADSLDHKTIAIAEELSSRGAFTVVVPGSRTHKAKARSWAFHVASPEALSTWIHKGLFRAAVICTHNVPAQFYNLCELRIPIFLNERWKGLFDPEGVHFYRSPNDIDLNAPARSLLCLYEGYYHPKFYANYFLHFVQEWSVNNLLRKSVLSRA